MDFDIRSSCFLSLASRRRVRTADSGIMYTLYIGCLPDHYKIAESRVLETSRAAGRMRCWSGGSMSKLDAVVGMSLRSFYRDICSGWCGRENEAVNLYTFGHLAKQVRPGSPLYDLTQIGIEVAVR